MTERAKRIREMKLNISVNDGGLRLEACGVKSDLSVVVGMIVSRLLKDDLIDLDIMGDSLVYDYAKILETLT